MKYLILQSKNGVKMPVVFSENLTHSEVARQPSTTVFGAGFCYLKGGEFQVTGKSESLGMESKPYDAEIINLWFGSGDAVMALV